MYAFGLRASAESKTPPAEALAAGSLTTRIAKLLQVITKPRSVAADAA